MLYLKDSTLRGSGVFTDSPVISKKVVAELRGKLVPLAEASPYSMQISAQTALEGKGDLEYINHTCNPNCKMTVEHGVLVVALRDIKEGEEITINYNASHYNIGSRPEESFRCACKSEHCCKDVRGLKFLSPEECDRLEDQLLPYLKTFLQGKPQPYGELY